MGRAIDLFVTYRFIKLLVTPFEKTEAFKLGIIDKDGARIMPAPVGGVRQTKPEPLRTTVSLCFLRRRLIYLNLFMSS